MAKIPKAMQVKINIEMAQAHEFGAPKLPARPFRVGTKADVQKWIEQMQNFEREAARMPLVPIDPITRDRADAVLAMEFED